MFDQFEIAKNVETYVHRIINTGSQSKIEELKLRENKLKIYKEKRVKTLKQRIKSELGSN